MAQNKSKERREEPLGTMSYQSSSKRSPPFWLLISARKTQVFWHQSEDRTAATVWNWSGKTLSPGALLTVLYFSLVPYFPACLDFPSPTICPWVSEDGTNPTWRRSEVALVFGDVRGYLETLFQASTLQLREDWATPRAGGSLRRKCAWAGYLHFTETGNRENELLGVLKIIIRLN